MPLETVTEDVVGPAGLNEAGESDITDEFHKLDNGGDIGNAISGVLDLGNN